MTRCFRNAQTVRYETSGYESTTRIPLKKNSSLPISRSLFLFDMQTFEVFSNSIDYLVKTNIRFEYRTYYNNFCPGFTRDQTKQKLIKDLESCIFEFDVNDNKVNNWIAEQLNNDVPVSLSKYVINYLNSKYFIIGC